MTDHSAVPETAEFHPPGDKSQDIHPLTYKTITAYQSADGWLASIDGTTDPGVLHALIETGFPGHDLERRSIADAIVRDNEEQLIRRLVYYLRFADGRRSGVYILRQKDDSSWSSPSPHAVRVVETLVEHAYRVIAERFFSAVEQESDIYGIVRVRPDLARAILNFAVEKNLPRWGESGREKIERFFVRFCSVLWKDREWNSERPALLRLLHALKRLDVLLDKDIVVDKNSMETIKQFALKDFPKSLSVEEAAYKGVHAAQVLLLLRNKHSEHRKVVAAEEAERRRAQEERHRQELVEAEKQRAVAERRLAELKTKKP